MVAKQLRASERLATWLREQGFQVVSTNIRNSRSDYAFWKVAGKNITGGFCEPTSEVHKQINGRFAADHVDSFDKWAKCPLVINVTHSIDFEALKRYLDFLGSEEGFKHSDTFAYLDESILPRVA